MPETAQPQPFGRYVLLRQIGAGGMAEIYKAAYRAEEGMEKTLVIKRIHPHLARDPDFVSMFREEAKLTLALSHANLVQVFDFGRDGEVYFLAMEFVNGRDLRAVMRQCAHLGSTLPIPFVLHVITEVAKGLAYAHGRIDESGNPLRVIHRDVTPANVLVSYEGEVKIADFGIARAAARASGTRSGVIKGKASYLAPEQLAADAGEIDARVDVFALGAVLWELLVGKKLFEGENELQTMERILKSEIQPPSKVNAAVPPEFDPVVLKALARDRDKRYPTALAFQKDLLRLQQIFAGTVTPVDIGAFLKRLFRDEIEEEKREDSRSLSIARESSFKRVDPGSASLIAPAPGTATPPAPARVPPLVLGIGAASVLLFLATLAVAGYVWQGRSAETGAAAIATPFATATPAPLSSAPPDALPTPTPALAQTPAPNRTPIAGQPRATPKPTAVVAAAAGKTGTLTVRFDGWAVIKIDGKPIGKEAAFQGYPLPAGRHTVTAERGWEARREYRIDVEAGKETVVDVRF